MATDYDTIVVGVGGMGSAATYHLSRRGQSVLGLERFDVPNSRGSSHGVNRIIRLAYYEDPAYVPLLRRAYTLWRGLSAVHGEPLLHVTGSIDAGPEGHPIVDGSIRSCEAHDIDHRVYRADELNDRFPGYRLPGDYVGVYQADGGFVLSERAIVAHVQQAHAHGARIHGRERVIDWQSIDGGVRVSTDRDDYTAETLVITAGAWASKHVDRLERLAVPERQVLGWFQPKEPAAFDPSRFPVFNLATDDDRLYGFPVFGVPGFKIGKYHHRGETVDPDAGVPEPTVMDENLLRGYVERYFPDAAGPTMRLETCLFTNSPDERFIIDRLPDAPEVIVATGFSGHGYKFASVVGEVIADLAVDGDTDHPIDAFSLDRFH